MKTNPKTQHHEFLCEGPREFGPSSAKVCCHGWNVDHFLDYLEMQRTQQLIDFGVIITKHGQRIMRRTSDGTYE